MIDIDYLEKLIDSPNAEIHLSKPWLRELVKELRANRATIDRLASKKGHEENIIRVTKTTMSTSPFPQKEFDETMGLFDKTMSSMSRMFKKINW